MLVTLAVATCGNSAGQESVDSGGARTIASGLSVPWGGAIHPGGDPRVSERLELTQGPAVSAPCRRLRKTTRSSPSL